MVALAFGTRGEVVQLLDVWERAKKKVIQCLLVPQTLCLPIPPRHTHSRQAPLHLLHTAELTLIPENRQLPGIRVFPIMIFHIFSFPNNAVLMFPTIQSLNTVWTDQEKWLCLVATVSCQGRDIMMKMGCMKDT